MASRLNLWLPCQPRTLLQAGEVPSFRGDTHALDQGTTWRWKALTFGRFRLAPRRCLMKWSVPSFQAGILQAFSHQYIHTTQIHTWGRAGQTCVKVRAPPVAILLFHLISSHHCLGTACGNTVFCCSGTASGDPWHFISLHDFCGHRLWRLSFLLCHTVSCMFGHHQWQLFYVI